MTDKEKFKKIIIDLIDIKKQLLDTPESIKKLCNTDENIIHLDNLIMAFSTVIDMYESFE